MARSNPRPRSRPTPAAATQARSAEPVSTTVLPSRAWAIVFPLLVISAGLYAYHNSLNGPLVYDDLAAITENPLIRTLWPPWHVLTPPPGSPLMHEVGRPTVILSLATNYALGGLNVRGYHVFNLAVHLLVALALYGVVRRTLLGPVLRSRYGTEASSLAVVVAVIWVVHPLTSESVTYIIERTESLMGVFLLWTLYAVIRAASPAVAGGEGGAGSRRPAGWYVLAVVCCALGMGSKEVMIVAPFVILAYDRLFLSPSFREALRRRAPLYGVFAALIVLEVPLSHRFANGRGLDVANSLDYLKTESAVIVYYLRLAAWPYPLVADYSDWPLVSSIVTVLPQAVVVIALLSATGWAFHRGLPVAFIGAWFFLLLAPTSSFFPIVKESIAERRMYLPLAALIALVVIGGHTLIRAYWSRLGWPAHWRRFAEAGVVVVLVATLAQVTVARNEDFQSTTAFWNDIIAKRPNNARAHVNLGDYLYRQGQSDEALGHFREALRINPGYADAYYGLGTVLASEGKVTDAVAAFQEAIRIFKTLEQDPDIRMSPGYAWSYLNLGNARAAQGKLDEAIADYTEAIRLRPGETLAHNNLGNVLVKKGELAKAAAEYAEALRLNADDALTHTNLGDLLARQGKIDEAVAQYREALRIDPRFAPAHKNVALALARLTRFKESIAELEEALRLAPDAETHFYLAEALSLYGNTPEAVQHLEAALALDPNFQPARAALQKLGEAGQQTGDRK
jgi:tetratricopeptide (TPR) repeat protein